MAADTTPANNSGGLTDDQKAALRDVLGLTDQADDATFAAALEALVKKAQADAGEDAADGGADEATEDASAGGDSAAADDQTDDPKKVAASVGTATVTIDAAAWDDLQTFIASAREREKADRERAADEMVDAAFKAGKIARTSVAAYKTAARKDPDGTKSILDTLAASAAFPVGELGHSVDVADNPEDVRTNAAYKNWSI